ncbi:hypothetical protein [Halothece sp. PCC 7418]|uniref:hypothetical protein n=1 Tax=Halothece sp. (strain PCC 7418) TaxID=65093 RepID=UPI00123738A1|nr:hypothetical protein [Halothece sp. PCC 7418]
MWRSGSLYEHRAKDTIRSSTSCHLIFAGFTTQSAIARRDNWLYRASQHPIAPSQNSIDPPKHSIPQQPIALPISLQTAIALLPHPQNTRLRSIRGSLIAL